MTELECDILVIGSGAAGGVLAASLSEFTDKRIILLEKGGYFTRTFFDQRELDMRVLSADSGTRLTSDGWIPVAGGECVGGGSTVNFALAFDPIPKVWDGWKTATAVSGFSFSEGTNDYGVRNLNMPYCLDEIRRRLNVHFPGEAEINENNRVFKRGCDALRIPTRRCELNMRGCTGCGFCALGCAYDHKLSTLVTYIRDALDRGVRLVHHSAVEKLEFPSDNDAGALIALATVRPTTPGSEPNSVDPGMLRIRAGMIIVSAGAIESPALLQRSRYPDPYGVLGTGLVLHPSLAVVGVFDRKIESYRGITGAYYTDHYYESNGFYCECLFCHPTAAAASLPFIGAEHFYLMQNYSRLAAFGVMLIDTVDKNNRVVWDERARKTSIHYQLSEDDKHRLRFAAQRGVEIMLAAGARSAYLTSEEPVGPLPAPIFRDPSEARYCADLRFLPFQTTLLSAHCQATVKMSERPELGTVNSRCESHFCRRLLVCDSSSFPTSCGANPMISIMTLARYQARRISGEITRYFAA